NDFQDSAGSAEATLAAQQEFLEVVDCLKKRGVEVLVGDPPAGPLPDAIFPNNWLSTHPEGFVFIYPMKAPSRRKERNPQLLSLLKEKFQISYIYDLSGFEERGLFLEGTGSLVFDHTYKRIFAALSQRTHEALVKLVGQLLGYDVMIFTTRHPYTGRPLYHTNVMMSVSPSLAIWIPSVIPDSGLQHAIRQYLETPGRIVIDLPTEALGVFAANVLMLLGEKGPFLVASQTAEPWLRDRIPADVQLQVCAIPTIERLGGGSVRCMLCENFLSPGPGF
ncbi:MAG: arginine deiminase-related protein, partial [Flavobacteriales bacterium]|nr:arginine deiminase-related protein [Flavobacteriales bacterium]MDW8410794.1 arginine deiminase-related protein [Flavobacteriales bacterium]